MESKSDWNFVRKELRKNSRISEGEYGVLKSLQICGLHQNLNVLNNHIERLNHEELVCHLKGLRYVIMVTIFFVSFYFVIL